MVKIKEVPPVVTVRVEDRHSATEFDGDLIAEVSTRKPDSTRWVEIRLYHLADEAGWLVHRVGQSLIYHQADGATCKTSTQRPSGDTATAKDLPAEAASCDRCQPPWPEDLAEDEKIRYEFPRHTIDRCETPAQVIRRLTVSHQRGSGMRSTMVSEPVSDLLRQAAENDPDFARAEKPVERIT
jgi:hypothetical protein